MRTASHTSRAAIRFWGLLLVAGALIAYWPVLHGGFIWDDDSWTTGIKALLGDASGLRAIWFQPTALQQYYPLTATTFWLDYHLWGFSTLPYHVENVLLHACAALLFWRLLARLEVPGAWLAAGIFALHPLMVESAGWITERKNVLSLVFYLGALLAYGRFAGFWREEEFSSPAAPKPGPRPWGAWALAFFLLLGALLAKTTAFSFPAVILLLCWWKGGRIRWRADVLPALPFFALALSLSMVTASLEKNHVGAQGPDWAIAFPERCLIAGRAFWFYLGKLLWPAGLCFVYPRWKLDASSPAQWLYPATAAGALLGLWLARKRMGRGPATAIFFYVGTLFPVLGFMNAYFMLYSFVCDHWTYLSSLGPIALAGALIARAGARFRVPAAPYVIAVAVLPVCAALTWRQCGMYADMETLWRTTLARNPDCWMGQNNLGLALANQGNLDGAIAHYERALQLKPDYAHAHDNLGNALAGQGMLEAAIQHYQQALQFDPNFAAAYCNLGIALARQGKLDEADAQFKRALQLKPDEADVHYNFGMALAGQGKLAEAIQHYERVIQLKPDYARVHSSLANALVGQGKLDEAIAHYERALQLEPDFAEVHFDLGVVLSAQGKQTLATEHLQQALNLATAQNNPALANAVRARLRSMPPALSQPQTP